MNNSRVAKSIIAIEPVSFKRCWLVMCFLLCQLVVNSAIGQTSVAGGSSASPVDITSYLLSNTSLNLLGGTFVVTIPVAGSPGTTAAEQLTGLTAKLVDYGAGHFVGASAPTIRYSGVISGVGELVVTNSTNASSNPGTDQTFDGGVLLFTSPQTFTNPGNTALQISPNTTVAFDLGGNLGVSGGAVNNVVNNGYLYSWNLGNGGNQTAWGDIISSISGAGVVTLENGNVLSDGHNFTGQVYVLNGSHVQQQGQFPDPALKLVQSNIFSFETQGSNYLTQESAISYRSLYQGNYYSFGVDSQIVGKGIQVFTGLELSSIGSTKKDFLPISQSRQFDYFNSFGGFGVAIDVQATMQMGNGQPIVTTVDTNNGFSYPTNNTFLQTNIAASNINIGGFENAPTTQSAALFNQAIGFDYSGTYSYDAGINVRFNSDGLLQVLPANGVVTVAGFKYGNLIVVNPDPTNTGKAPNHLILTSPLAIHGVTQVDPNAILQLGDGTIGNSSARTLIIAGVSYPGTYSSSYGNGAIATKINAPSTTINTAFDEILDNGAIIVDNVPGAFDMVQIDSSLVSLMQSNELDTISGVGSLEQKGSLPLTLAGVNTYTGGTTIDVGATLLVATPTALGAASATASNSGSLINSGVLASTAGNRKIVVPGNYTQTGGN